MNSRITMLLGIFFLVLQLAGCGGGGGGGTSADSGGSVAGDTKSPTVIFTNPVVNSTAVEINRVITATFNEPMAPGTITVNSFLVEDPTGAVISDLVTYDEASRTATFRPRVALSPETTHVATITADAADLAGNRLGTNYSWQFTTGNAFAAGTVDTTPPTVLSRFPAANAGSVALNTDVWVTFSEPIDPLTINAQTLTLNGTQPITGTVTTVGMSAIFHSGSDLLADTVYTVSVGGAIKDLAGNSLGTDVVWIFTTGNQLDLLGPQVQSVSPPAEAVNVPTTASIVVNFDEAIEPFQFGTIDGRPVVVTFNDEYTTVTMVPTAGTSPGLTYDSLIFVADAAGNLMDNPFVWKFSIAP